MRKGQFLATAHERGGRRPRLLGRSLQLWPAAAVAGVATTAGLTPSMAGALDLSSPSGVVAPLAVPACALPFDILNASVGLVEKCGLVAYPGASTGGRVGRGYLYDIAGAEVVYDPPPAGFDPLKATSAELARYGVPAPPHHAGARDVWARRMAKLRFVPAPRFLVALPVAAASSTFDFSDHWAGYVAYGGPFDKASSTWVEPFVGRSRCRRSSLTIWTGIGGYGSGSLAQDGTAKDTPEVGQDQAFWELTPVGMVPVPLYATPGAPFTADVTYRGHGRFFFFMENDFTGAAFAATETSANGASLTSAESIVERPCLAGCDTGDATYSNLSNFGHVLFTQSTANGRPIGTFSNYREDMSSTGWSYGDDLAEPGRLSGNAMSFSVTQRSCS